MSSPALEIGRRFIIGLSGSFLSELDRRILSELKPAGVILRAHNFASTEDYPTWLSTLAQLQADVASASQNPSPIFGLDHEGGRVHRVPAPLTHFPSARHYASHAGEVARAMALELKSIGINFSFAPVADIDSNPKNPVIGARAFGSSALAVAEAAKHFALELKAGGIVAAAKHFPGHGDTTQDSHHELPELSLTVEALKHRELVPFRAVIDAGVPVLLSAHVMFPSLDSEFPATLSPLVLRHLAREELKFSGVIMSDDLDMKAIADNFSDEEVALQAFKAGCDLLLFNHDPERALRVARLAEELLDAGTLDAEDFGFGSLRVKRLLEKEVKRYIPRPLTETELKAHEALRADTALNQ